LLTRVRLGAPQRTQRGAGEGELVFELTGHGAMLPEDDLVEQGEVFA
jgi:hypothetical protein